MAHSTHGNGKRASRIGRTLRSTAHVRCTCEAATATNAAKLHACTKLSFERSIGPKGSCTTTGRSHVPRPPRELVPCPSWQAHRRGCGHDECRELWNKYQRELYHARKNKEKNR